MSKQSRTSKILAVAQELSCLTGLQQKSDKDCQTRRHLPSPDEVVEIVDVIKKMFFPRHFYSDHFIGIRQRKTDQEFLDDLCSQIEDQIVRGLCAVCTEQRDISECKKQAEVKSVAFIEQLPKVNKLLQTDIIAAYNGDPAAINHDEIISCYPGFHAMISYRLAHELYTLEVPLIPRMITERAHTETGIDIHPGATIDESFFIDHGTGVVIGETCRIGKNVTVYQGVTLGAKSFPLDEQGNPVKGVDRHPIVQDEVIIYSDATILGRITLGKGSIIGGNVWLTKSVPPKSFITQAMVRSERFVDGGGI